MTHVCLKLTENKKSKYLIVIKECGQVNAWICSFLAMLLEVDNKSFKDQIKEPF